MSVHAKQITAEEVYRRGRSVGYEDGRSYRSHLGTLVEREAVASWLDRHGHHALAMAVRRGDHIGVVSSVAVELEPKEHEDATK